MLKRILTDERRLILFTGKGGVGKSVISCAAAVALAKKGKRVLLVEFNSPGALGTLLEGKRSNNEIRQTRVPRISVLNIDPKDSLDRYIQEQVHFTLLYNLIRSNKILGFFFRATPGLDEILMFHYLDELVRNEASFDHVIFDAPPTGHGLTLIKIPFVFNRFLSFGKQRKDVEEIIAMLRKATINIVTLLEELPVNETIEYVHKLREYLPENIGCIVLNRTLDLPLDRRFFHDDRLSNLPARNKDERLFLTELVNFRERVIAQGGYKQEIARLALPMVEVPQLFVEDIGVNELDKIAEHLL